MEQLETRTKVVGHRDRECLQKREESHSVARTFPSLSPLGTCPDTRLHIPPPRIIVKA